jgi:hypothetical protein
MLVLLILLSLSKPTEARQLVPVQQFKPADVAMDSCPAFTHLHPLGKIILDDPSYNDDGLCHDDQTDRPVEVDKEPRLTLPKSANGKMKIK